ncbi:hypothetical protein DFH09DRAFT_1076056 [Mycena vulgaris]|nr:hypothetical protein DFH09DRAFT_1076056 [Mycena vulgaris]
MSGSACREEAPLRKKEDEGRNERSRKDATIRLQLFWKRQLRLRTGSNMTVSGKFDAPTGPDLQLGARFLRRELCSTMKSLQVIETSTKSKVGSPFSSSATMEDIRILDRTIIPALNLAKAGVTGIGIPGLEPVVNSTMKGTKKDVTELEKWLKTLAANAMNVSDTSGDLKNRLTTLSLKFTAAAVECKSLGEKSRMDRFFRSQEYKAKILDIRNTVAADIREFTFYGNISIEKLVRDIASKVGAVYNNIHSVFANDILAKLKCSAARHNAENTPEKCMDGTRVDLVEEIVARLTGPLDTGQRVVILSGSAGTGKSTIAKSIATRLAEVDHTLAASFFFSRDFAERSNIKLLPSTLARQLADYNPEFRYLLVKLLDEDRVGILSAEPRLQFQKLVVEILAQMLPIQTPWIICLDALDECGTDRGQLYLRWLSDSIAVIPPHVRFFLTGRPNIPMYLKFDSLRSLTDEIILDDIDASQVDRDIQLYVTRSLDGSTWIARDPWKASTQDVDEITNRADGLFIFAATAVRYILSALPQTHPQRSIDYLLGGAPLTDLDDLYSRVVGEAITSPCPGDHRARDYRDRANLWHPNLLPHCSTWMWKNLRGH